MKIFVSGLYSRMFSAFSIASNKIVSPHDVQFLSCIELFGGTVRMRMFANPTNVGHPIIFRVAALQAATILVAMASEKKFWRPKFSRKSPIGDQQINRETYLKNYQ